MAKPLDRYALLRQEMTLHRVSTNASQGPSEYPDDLIVELSYALEPPIHERRLPTYGALLRPKSALPAGTRAIHPTDGVTVEKLRMLADGRRSFLVRGEDGGIFLAILATELDSEGSLVRLVGEIGACVIQRDRNGRVRIYTESRTITHDNRVWSDAPTIAMPAATLLLCATGGKANPEVLRGILEFAYYELSPRFVGATLLWQWNSEALPVAPCGPRSENLAPLGLTVSSASDRTVVRHLLSQVDGATTIDAAGVVLRTKEQLNVSQDARQLVREHGGTRHTSARRFTFDFPNVIAIVVSEDGPVSIFVNGALLPNFAEVMTGSMKSGKKLGFFAIAAGAVFGVKDSMRLVTLTLVCPACRKRAGILALAAIAFNGEQRCLCPTCGGHLKTLSGQTALCVPFCAPEDVSFEAGAREASLIDQNE